MRRSSPNYSMLSRRAGRVVTLERMATPLNRTLAALSLAAVATVGLTACGNTATDAPAATQSTSAATQTTEPAQTQAPAPAVAGQLTKDNFAQVVNDAMLQAKTAHISMETTTMGMTITMSGEVVLDADPAKIAMSIDTDTLGMTMNMLMVDGRLYANFGEMSQNKFIDLSDSADGGESFAASIDQADPMLQMEAMAQSITSFEASSATETVNGVEAFRYDVSLDTAKMMALSGQADTLAAAGSNLPQTLDQVLWITPDGLLVKVEQALALEVEGQKLDSLTVINYSDWGKSVTITAPDADQVIPASQLGM